MTVATLSLFSPDQRVTRPAFVPGDDGTKILARDARPVAREATKLPETPAVGGQSLDAVLVDAWEGLIAHRTVSCPVCRGALRPRYGATVGVPSGGRCDRCDSTLS